MPMLHSIPHKHFNQLQAEFMQVCGQLKMPLAEAVERLYTKEVKSAVSLWLNLIDEEGRRELRTNVLDKLFSNYVIATPSERLEVLVQWADDIADTIYVLCGLANCLGIPIHRVYEEVHASNMLKAVPVYDAEIGQIIDYKVERRQDGKILKPEGWKPPNIASILSEEYARTLPMLYTNDADTRDWNANRT